MRRCAAIVAGVVLAAGLGAPAAHAAFPEPTGPVVTVRLYSAENVRDAFHWLRAATFDNTRLVMHDLVHNARLTLL